MKSDYTEKKAEQDEEFLAMIFTFDGEQIGYTTQLIQGRIRKLTEEERESQLPAVGLPVHLPARDPLLAIPKAGMEGSQPGAVILVGASS